jgi:hypothetical protein
MRLLFRRFPIAGGLFFFALLCVAAFASLRYAMARQAGPTYFRGNGATLIVANTNDSGPGSLRQALADVPDGGTIQFNPALNGQTITLTSAELVINNSITISGPGPGFLRVARDQQATNFRILHLLPNHTVEISGLTISNGQLQSENGGGILNDQATLTMINCAISGNVVIANGSPPSQAGGGGIYNNGTLSLVSSTVSGNSATGPWSYGGGGIYNAGAVTITQSSISGNTGDMSGGGIHNGGMLTISDSTVSSNHTSGFGHGQGFAGGIFNGGTLTIQNTTISGNSVAGEGGFGGGIYGNSTITNSAISGNIARGGGGISGGGTITNSTISGNSSQLVGGGIYGSVTISNSTISGNTVVSTQGIGGGGIYGGGTITNSTISGNTANQGGGIYATSAVQLGNTILKAGATGANLFNNGGSVTSHGYNLSSDNGGGFLTGPGDQINTDPLLGPLQNNGGPTFTHELLTGSPAVNTGDPNFTPPPEFDQRGPGYPRVFNGRIDIGSFEIQSGGTPSPTPTPTPSPGICGAILYDQTSNAATTAIISQNFEAANDGFDSQVADDFVVPTGPVWTIQRVNVSGIYFNGPGPAASVNVTFYSNSGTLPGAALPGGTYTNLPMTDTAGNFSIPLPSNLALTSGTYWVSVQANMDFNSGGEWGWVDRTGQSLSAAAWQNPGGSFGFGCLIWGARGATCGIDPATPDQIFQIVGCLGAPSPTPTPTSVSISGTISYCPNPVPGPVPNVTLSLTGSVSGTTLSNGSGNYQFSSLPSGGNYTVTPSKAALPPGSAGIDTVDVVATQRHFLNIGTPLSGCRLAGADVNGDSAVNTVDVVAIQRFFLGTSTGIANVGKYQFIPANRNYLGIVTDQTGQNYDTLVFGDVASPFTAP